MHSDSNLDERRSANKSSYSSLKVPSCEAAVCSLRGRVPNKVRLISTIASPKLPLNVRKESTLINPWFITGFTDAEGCFSIRVRRTTRTRIGWHVECVFSICLHLRDLPLLQQIQSYFGGVGRISVGKNCGYFVSSPPFGGPLRGMEDITTVIIPHFVKYPLITQKLGDFLLFKSVIDMINAKEHLTMEGLQKIVSIKASVNHGLTESLKVAFPNTIPALKPLSVNTDIPHPYWMAGFTSGDGCFAVTENKTSSGIYVKLVFSITQDRRDENLIRSFIDFFGCGTYSPSLKRTTVDFQCRKFKDNFEKIIPFFCQYNIIGVKLKDFQDWCKIAELINNKDHLTQKGFDEICQIKSGMNKLR